MTRNRGYLPPAERLSAEDLDKQQDGAMRRVVITVRVNVRKIAPHQWKVQSTSLTSDEQDGALSWEVSERRPRGAVSR